MMDISQIVPSLPPQVQRSLVLLRAEGIEPTAEEGAWLADLWRRATDPAAGFSPFLPGAPVRACGLELWPLHALALDWYVRLSDLLPDQSSDLYLYAHTCSDPGDTSLQLLADPDKASRVVGEWRASIALHDDVVPQLMRFLRLLDGDETATPPLPDEDAEASPGPPALASLCALYCDIFPGTTPEYWKTGISQADAKALAAAKTDNPEWSKSERMRQANVNYMRAVQWIRLRKPEIESNG